MIAMVSCGQGLAIMPELMFKMGVQHSGCQVLRLQPAAGAHHRCGLPGAQRPFAGGQPVYRACAPLCAEPAINRGAGLCKPGKNVYNKML